MSTNQSNRGRNNELIQYRNRKLVARFYYYSSLLGLKFSRCLKHLVVEFDLSESRICDLISEQSEMVSEMEIKKIGIAELRSAYPFMNWQNPSSNQWRNAQQLSLDLFADFAP